MLAVFVMCSEMGIPRFSTAVVSPFSSSSYSPSHHTYSSPLDSKKTLLGGSSVDVEVALQSQSGSTKFSKVGTLEVQCCSNCGCYCVMLLTVFCQFTIQIHTHSHGDTTSH